MRFSYVLRIQVIQKGDKRKHYILKRWPLDVPAVATNGSEGLLGAEEPAGEGNPAIAYIIMLQKLYSTGISSRGG